MADQNLSVDIKIKADTSGAKEAEKAIDGLTQAIEEQAVAEKELVTETEKVVVEEKKLVEVEKEAEKAVEKTTAAKRKKKDATKEQKKEDEVAVVETQKVIEAEKKEIAVTEELTTAKKRKTKATEQENTAVNNTTVTGNGAAQTKREMAKAAKELERQTTQSAMGFMALSNAFQDVQYGMAGMINNIPGIVTGMGMGMGVAGTVQIAAVGLQVLLKNVDLFGEKAKEAARNAADLASEAMADADAAYKAAEATKTATEAQDRHNEAMQAAEERYKEQIRLSEELIKQKQAEKDAEIALADAQAAFEMAQIQLAEGRGEISKEEAIIARNKVRTEADARKQTAAIALEEAKVAEARKKAAAEEAQAQANRGMALQLTGEGQGMLTKEDRVLAEENKGSAQTQLESSKLRREALAKQIAADQKVMDGINPLGVFDKEKIGKMLEENRAKLAKETEEAAKLQADINREDAKLKKDKEARDRTGLKDGDRLDLDKAIQAQFREAKAGEARAGELRGEAAAGEAGIARSQRLFGFRQATGAMASQYEIEENRKKQREEADKAREKAMRQFDSEGYSNDFVGPIPTKAFTRKQTKRETDIRQVGTAGGALASSLSKEGLAPGFTDQLRGLSEGAGDENTLSRLIAMVAMLTKNSAKLSEQSKSKLDKLEAEIADLRTAK